MGLPRIESVWVWVCTDAGDNTEGIPALAGPGGQPLPMFATRKEIAEMMRPAAEQMVEMGHKMALVEFTARITLEEVK